MVKQSMAEEDTVGDEYDGIMSEDAAEEKEGPQALNTTSRQLRYYYCRKLLERMPQHRAHRAEALQSIILSATPTSRKAYKKCGIMVKTCAPIKQSLMPEFKRMVMDWVVTRKISSNHALRIKRKCKKTSKKWLRHWLFLKTKCTRILACSLGLPNLEKAGFPTMDESNSGFLLQRRHKQSCTRENNVIFLQTTQGKVSSEHHS